MSGTPPVSIGVRGPTRPPPRAAVVCELCRSDFVLVAFFVLWCEDDERARRKRSRSKGTFASRLFFSLHSLLARFARGKKKKNFTSRGARHVRQSNDPVGARKQQRAVDMRVELQVYRSRRKVKGTQRPRGRRAHVEDSDDRVGGERAPDDDGSCGGEEVPAAVRGEHRGPMRGDVCATSPTVAAATRPPERRRRRRRRRSW